MNITTTIYVDREGEPRVLTDMGKMVATGGNGGVGKRLLRLVMREMVGG